MWGGGDGGSSHSRSNPLWCSAFGVRCSMFESSWFQFEFPTAQLLALRFWFLALGPAA